MNLSPYSFLEVKPIIEALGSNKTEAMIEEALLRKIHPMILFEKQLSRKIAPRTEIDYSQPCWFYPVDTSTPDSFTKREERFNSIKRRSVY